MRRTLLFVVLVACDPKPEVAKRAPAVASSASASASVSAAASASVSTSASILAAPPRVLDPAVREEIAVADERWRLVWREPPKPICHDWTAPEVGAMCSCFAYDFAEAGKMDLVRMKDGVKIDALDVSRLAGEISDYVLWVPHWRRGPNDVREKVSLDEAKRGETITLMRPIDYDHDGRATEVALLVNNGGPPCGHYNHVIVVGTSVKNPKLHAFADTSGATVALRGFDDWKKLASAKAGERIRVDDLTCGDHGSPTQQWRDVWWDAGGIHVESKEGKCP